MPADQLECFALEKSAPDVVAAQHADRGRRRDPSGAQGQAEATVEHALLVVRGRTRGALVEPVREVGGDPVGCDFAGLGLADEVVDKMGFGVFNVVRSTALPTALPA